MDKPKIRIIDNIFSHAPNSFGCGDLPNIFPDNFLWHRGGQIGDIVVITETSFDSVDSCKEKVKILLIVECPSINPDIYKKISQPKYYSKFDYILTHSQELCKLNKDKFVWYSFGGCWIHEADRTIHTKSKNISIIASSKRHTVGHKLRHEAIDKYRVNIDGIFGNGYQSIENKLQGLGDYRYSIVIENDNNEGWFTEKLNDCFVTGTIPIYWGTKDIGEYFNKEGMICFDNIDELGMALDLATEEFYNSKLEVVKENFERVRQYTLPENYIWNNFLKDIYALTQL